MVARLLSITLLFSLLVPGIASAQIVRIANDPGGQIGTYIDKYRTLNGSGDRVIIDGLCASACTIVLGVVSPDRICVTPRARLGFHAAWDYGENGRTVTNPEATRVLYDMYPSKVRKWINAHGGLRSRMIFLSGKSLAGMGYRSCPAQVPVYANAELR